MFLYPCELTFHDNLFYETRTLGRLYETGRLLHNIALCYALGFAQTPFHHADDVPRYSDEVGKLNEAGIYVTPAAGVDVRYVVHTFKFGDEQNAIFMEKSNANRPTYGRAKEIAVNSRFRFGVLSEHALTFPRWIRMGLWLSKAQLVVHDPVTLQRVATSAPQIIRHYPLNPLDLPPTAQVRLFDLVSMRPSSLMENAEVQAALWWQGQVGAQTVWLPQGLTHRVQVGKK